MDQQEFVQHRHKEDRLEDIINLFDYEKLSKLRRVLFKNKNICVHRFVNFFLLHHLFPSERCCCSETNKRSIGVPT